TSYQTTHPVFHHRISTFGDVFLESGGTTDPAAPGDSAANLFFPGSDIITFPDVDFRTEGVAFAAIDVQRGIPPIRVRFVGDNGFVDLTTNSVFNAPPQFIIVGTSSGTGPFGSLVNGPPLQPLWDTLGVDAVNAQVNGAPLGMIHSIIVFGGSETA